MGWRRTMAALAAAGLLGAGCVGAPAQPEVPAAYQATYLEGARLEFEAEIDGETVRKYTERNEWDDIYTYVEVVQEGGSTVIYSDNDWSTASYYSDKEIDEVVFIEGEEAMRIQSYGAWVTEDGTETRYPEPGYSSGDFGVPVMELAQERFDEYLEKIAAYERQRDRDYNDSTLTPLQQWALERLEAPEPVLPAPEPVEEEPWPVPEPVDVEMREVHPYLIEQYLGLSDLVGVEQTGRAVVRTYEDEDTTYLVVDQADGTSLFFSDWQKEGDLDSFAITYGDRTVFFEKARMRVLSGEEEQEILNKWPPESVWAEARALFDHYRSFAPPEGEEDNYSAEEMENWALGGLGED